MNVIVKLVYNVILLFIMMVPGIIMKKCRLCDESFGKGLSNLVLYIAQPALTFVAYLRPYNEKILINSAYVLAFSVILHSLFAVVAMNMFKKQPDSMQRMLRFATVFSNVAFMGIPLIAAVLESDYPGSTVYALIYSVTFNVFLWSLGVRICTDGKDENGNSINDYHEAKKIVFPWKAFLHPITIASFIGIFFFIFPIEGYVPDIAEEAFVALKNLVAPLSMLVIGLRLPDIKLDDVRKDKGMYLFLLLRHIALPLLAIGLLKVTGLFVSIDPAVEMVVVILAAAPAATSATMFAEKYDCDAVYVSKLVTVSTILSILTIPLLLFLV